MPSPAMMRMRSPQYCLGDAFEPVPRRLREPRAREEIHLHAREKRLTQLRVLLQRDGQFFPALRHVEVDRRRDFTQVAQRFLELAVDRFAVVDIERAAVVERDARVMAAAEGVIPRQPVDQHRRHVRELRKRFEQHLLVAAQHAVRGRHGLRQFGRARREQKLGDGVRAHRRLNGIDCGRALYSAGR